MSEAGSIRTKKSRENKKRAGIKRKELMFSKDTFNILIELARKSGYEDVELSRRNKNGGINKKRNVIISMVLTQVVFEAYRKVNSNKLDSLKQEGYFLARQARSLRVNGATYKEIAEYLKRYKPSKFLDINDKKWNKNSLKKLYKNYGRLYTLSSAQES